MRPVSSIFMGNHLQNFVLTNGVYIHRDFITLHDVDVAIGRVIIKGRGATVGRSK